MHIHDDLLKLENLSCLYLHKNYFFDINEFLKLRKFQKLRFLTVHNNPIVKITNFWLYILGILPNLKKLDSVPITWKEKDNANVWINIFGNRKLPIYDMKENEFPPV